MSIGAGTISLRRLQILKPGFEYSADWVIGKIKKNLIRPIGLDDPREEAMGWCHPFTGDPEMGPVSKLSYENSLIFGLRIDNKRIPGTLFRLQLKAAYEEMQKKMPKQEGGVKGRLNKKMRDSVRDKIKDVLLKKTLPNIRLVEVVWHLDTNEVWIMSAAENVTAQFEKMFNESFALPFVQLNPGTMSINYDKALNGKSVPMQSYLDVIPTQLMQTASTRPSATAGRAKESSKALS